MPVEGIPAGLTAEKVDVALEGVSERLIANADELREAADWLKARIQAPNTEEPRRDLLPFVDAILLESFQHQHWDVSANAQGAVEIGPALVDGLVSMTVSGAGPGVTERIVVTLTNRTA